ncbi:carboxypeptidase regulatory-like domain-containing protein [Fulvivirga sp. RKSG066]|uniref:carboxypeptidase regulatory-like domain-containing protein n=1 Tax=Fulvivirga aurantia TaxID=2529383 RepID=UPI0012BC4D41|nr:carboxypeptidase regulatory-like domain-containing protein [Fulvivirga aurantia]MTI23207.1 carboxypeptidase regulatory-like domain-containing protein [Fulvivirga aurantia]
MRALLTLTILTLLIGCKTTVSQQMDQGIKGKVLWLEGNFMPGPGQSNEGQPVAKEIYIYEVLKAEDLEKEGQFYKTPNQEPTKIITSNEDGTFTVDLPAGTYSLFAMEPKGLYANLQDGAGNINPIRVVEGKYTGIVFRIDYKAVY